MAMCILRDVKRSQELSGGALELVGSSDDGHGEEVPETELRTNREAADEWKEPHMPSGKVVACESEAGANPFMKRMMEMSVTELERGCHVPPVDVSNTDCISRCGTVSSDTKVPTSVYVRSTRVQMTVDDD